jgi:hypothetical protein
MVDKSKLLAKRTKTKEVELPDVGTVKVRGLTKAEVEAYTDKDGEVNEAGLVATGLVDPVLTVEEVVEWLNNAPVGDYADVMGAIRDLSGLNREAAKSV